MVRTQAARPSLSAGQIADALRAVQVSGRPSGADLRTLRDALGLTRREVAMHWNERGATQGLIWTMETQAAVTRQKADRFLAAVLAAYAAKTPA
jgi:hypothetical protein